MYKNQSNLLHAENVVLTEINGYSWEIIIVMDEKLFLQSCEVPLKNFKTFSYI